MNKRISMFSRENTLMKFIVSMALSIVSISGRHRTIRAEPPVDEAFRLDGDLSAR
jgi:hypothetical protein